nr:class 1 fructose-bisphosphatase [Longibacter salinarum]
MSGTLESFMTLEQFIIDHQEESQHSTGAFSRLIRDISVAAKIINRNIRRAGLLDVFGASGEINVQGEVQKKLDVIADEEIVRALRKGGECRLIGSEEQSETMSIGDDQASVGRYAVYFDPLDGSSNTDVNASVGSIFSIYHLGARNERSSTLEEVLQPGSKQVAAGYVAYGSSTMFVYTTGDGVNGFTLDPEIGEFVLSHPDIRIPDQAKMYSINEADFDDFSAGVRRYLRWLKRPDEHGYRPIRHRYIGAFVSDFHRNLITGGIYMYPKTATSPEGKLRLMYEANPLAFIVEQAGGAASDGKRRILDIVPDDLHQRTPVFIGNTDLVQELERQLEASVEAA